MDSEPTGVASGVARERFEILQLLCVGVCVPPPALARPSSSRRSRSLQRLVSSNQLSLSRVCVCLARVDSGDGAGWSEVGQMHGDRKISIRAGHHARMRVSTLIIDTWPFPRRVMLSTTTSGRQRETVPKCAREKGSAVATCPLSELSSLSRTHVPDGPRFSFLHEANAHTHTYTRPYSIQAFTAIRSEAWVRQAERPRRNQLT